MASLARLLPLLLAACAIPAALGASKPRHPFSKVVFGVIGDWGNGPDGDFDPAFYGKGDQADHDYYKVLLALPGRSCTPAAL